MTTPRQRSIIALNNVAAMRAGLTQMNFCQPEWHDGDRRVVASFRVQSGRQHFSCCVDHLPEVITRYAASGRKVFRITIVQVEPIEVER